MAVRVRYAPSPTGMQHIGGVRTALFNYLFAMSKGGSFILRLEDTDRTRYAPEYEQNLYDSLNWLGFWWNEGPDKGGHYEPYVQSKRLELYRKHALELIDKGLAYYCFCDDERLERIRKLRSTNGMAPGYDRECRHLTAEETAAKLDSGSPYVIRLKIPLEGSTTFHDLLLGDITWQNEAVSPDPVLLKSDGFPTYHLANVVDDHYMDITHVMRAQEWVPSTPLHILMYNAFGWEHPEYCHLPMVMGKNGLKLSKRDGATSVNEFKAAGYLPEAIVNYVAMLGASYKEGKELYSMLDLIDHFDISKLNKAPAVFDYDKLKWYNEQHIRNMPLDELAIRSLPLATEAGVFGGEPSRVQVDLWLKAMPLVRERVSFMTDIPVQAKYLFQDFTVPAPDTFVPKKGNVEQAAMLLKMSRVFVERMSTLTNEQVEDLIKASASTWKFGDLMMVLRVAISGSRVSLPMFESIRIIGVGKALERIDAALETL
jgi:glutamyl-tRNA synthetase